MNNDPNNQPTEAIWRDILYARAWAQRYFNVDAEACSVWDPPTFYVRFPEVDKMRVAVKSYDRPILPWIEYRLAWLESGSMAWVGENPLTGKRIGPLVVGSTEALDTQE